MKVRVLAIVAIALIVMVGFTLLKAPPAYAQQAMSPMSLVVAPAFDVHPTVAPIAMAIQSEKITTNSLNTMIGNDAATPAHFGDYRYTVMTFRRPEVTPATTTSVQMIRAKLRHDGAYSGTRRAWRPIRA
ncbi:MAG: hypothetical protein KW802_00485 [Candidatus Doudnabacteria bacterium]|nr:hypothetical protein [Candidatus Doudnabacteria bacterium]